MTLNSDTNVLLLHLGEKLYKIRHLRKEKITSVASAINISHSVLSQVENGKYKSLSIDLLFKIAAYYNTQIDELLSNTGNNDKIESNAIIKLILSENKSLKEKLAELQNDKKQIAGL